MEEDEYLFNMFPPLVLDNEPPESQYVEQSGTINFHEDQPSNNADAFKIWVDDNAHQSGIGHPESAALGFNPFNRVQLTELQPLATYEPASTLESDSIEPQATTGPCTNWDLQATHDPHAMASHARSEDKENIPPLDFETTPSFDPFELNPAPPTPLPAFRSQAVASSAGPDKGNIPAQDFNSSQALPPLQSDPVARTPSAYINPHAINTQQDRTEPSPDSEPELVLRLRASQLVPYDLPQHRRAEEEIFFLRRRSNNSSTSTGATQVLSRPRSFRDAPVLTSPWAPPQSHADHRSNDFSTGGQELDVAGANLAYSFAPLRDAPLTSPLSAPHQGNTDRCTTSTGRRGLGLDVTGANQVYSFAPLRDAPPSLASPAPPPGYDVFNGPLYSRTRPAVFPSVNRDNYLGSRASWPSSPRHGAPARDHAHSVPASFPFLPGRNMHEHRQAGVWESLSPDYTIEGEFTPATPDMLRLRQLMVEAEMVRG